MAPPVTASWLAVIGDFAETPRYQGAGSSAVNALQVDTLLDSIKDVYKRQGLLFYAPICHTPYFVLQ